jgi:hypothetical protein
MLQIKDIPDQKDATHFTVNANRMFAILLAFFKKYF